MNIYEAEQYIRQKKCMEDHKDELAECLQKSIGPFLDHLRKFGVISAEERNVVEEKPSEMERILSLLEMIKTKDNGLTETLCYLENHDNCTVAKRLRESANEPANPSPSVYSQSELKSFSEKLAQYYRSTFGHTSTLGDSTLNHVQNVWVPMQVFSETGQLPYDKMLEELASNSQLSVALIEGDPGVGKTFLMKRIAFEWAQKYLDWSKHPELFSLVFFKISGRFNKSLTTFGTGNCESFYLHYKINVLDFAQSTLYSFTVELKLASKQL